jgi:hypothetical protein
MIKYQNVRREDDINMRDEKVFETSHFDSQLMRKDLIPLPTSILSFVVSS